MLVVSPVGILRFPLAVPLFLRVLFYVGENIMPDRNKRKQMQNSSDIEMEQTVSKLARYYRLDRKRKVFDIPMHFKKASDLFCGNVDFMDEPKISDKTTDMMVELLNDIPLGYKAELSITIDDYEVFSSRQILRGLNDALAFRHIRFVRENKRNGLHVGTLMVAGISLRMSYSNQLNRLKRCKDQELNV